MDTHDSRSEAECNRKRSLDRRRESSRHAARDRRGKEADIFIDLKEVVPIVEESTVTHVDRIALLRVASTLCRLRKNVAKCLKKTSCDDSQFPWSESTILECLDGFLAMIDDNGIILYITESVSIYLGLTQTDLVGRSLKEFVHTSDYEELIKQYSNSKSDERAMLRLRMKSVISPRGRYLNLRSAFFKPVECQIRSRCSDIGQVQMLQISCLPAGQGIAVKHAEVPSGTPVTRHTCDMKFTYISESFNYILRHESRSLMGTSFYNLVHPTDINDVASSMRETLIKGYTRTSYYRLIRGDGSVMWVQTEITTVNHTSKGQKVQYVICVHDLLGTQSEEESFGVHCPSCLNRVVPVKEEKQLKRNPGLKRRNSGEVLQWLLREHDETSLTRTTHLCHQDNNTIEKSVIGEEIVQVLENTTPMSLHSPRILSAESSSEEHSVGTGHRSSVQFSITEDDERCKKRKKSTVQSSTNANEAVTDLHSVSRKCSSEYLDGFSGDSLATALRLSSTTSSVTYLLPEKSNVGIRAAQHPDFYPSLPTSGANYNRGIDFDAPSQHQTPEFFGNPDFQMLAPFVANEDIVQLTTDIHYLLPDLDIMDWLPASITTPQFDSEDSVGVEANNAALSHENALNNSTERVDKAKQKTSSNVLLSENFLIKMNL